MQNQIGKYLCSYLNSGSFLLSLHLHAIKRKRKFYTCLHIGTIEKSDSCFSEHLPWCTIYESQIRYTGLLSRSSWLYIVLSEILILRVYWHLKKHDSTLCTIIYLTTVQVHRPHILHSINLSSDIKLVPESQNQIFETHVIPTSRYMEPAGIHPWV